jgi:hypothetical protein
MASQILFFKKNYADLEYDYVTVTASEGQDLATNILNRSNRSAWATVDSTDASGTTLEINLGDVRRVTDLLLLKHNFKSFHIEYYDDDSSVWSDFATPINPTDNAEASNHWNVSEVQTSKIRITINGTQTPDSDKYLYQFIVTERIGKLEGWPIIKDPTLSRDIKKTKMLSGKMHVVESVGFYSATLSVSNWKNASDLEIIEELYNSSEGFLFWPCGGDTSQFFSVRQGYRMEDIFLVRCMNEYQPEFAKGFYQSGIKIDVQLAEVIT